jgi:hypothetical protein
MSFPVGDNNPRDIYPIIPIVTGAELLPIANIGTTLLYLSTGQISDFVVAQGAAANRALSNLTGVAINASLIPGADNAIALGDGTHGYTRLSLSANATINANNGNAVISHSTGTWLVSAGDWRITTPGTNPASAVTVGGTQTLTNKTLTSPAITTPTVTGTLTANGAITTTGPVTITPAAANKGYLVQQTGPITSQTGPFIYNEIDVNDDVPATGDTRTMGFYMQYNTGGTHGTGGKYGGYFNMNHNVASVTGGDHIALVSANTSSVVDLSGGELYGQNGACYALSGCQTNGLNGMELDVRIDSGATVARRCGVRIVNEGNSQAVGLDAAYSIMSTTAGGGFKTGFALSTRFGQPGVSTVGDWFGLDGAHTIANFAACSNLTVTGKILDFPHVQVTGAGAITSNGPTAGIGYAPGAGGAVAQATSKSTGVTLNTVCGRITMDPTSLAAGAIATFVLTNSAIADADTLTLNHYGVGTQGAYTLNAGCRAGSAFITIRNNTAGALAEGIILQFSLNKGATS